MYLSYRVQVLSALSLAWHCGHSAPMCWWRSSSWPAGDWPPHAGGWWGLITSLYSEPHDDVW